MNAGPGPVSEQKADWDERALRWLAFDDDLERFAAPLGELAMDRLRPVPGERILDVGCGTGWSCAALAERVGVTGKVVGVDVSAVMADRIRENTRGLPNVEVLCADAGTYDFDGDFDAVYSRFGVMFFEDPVGAFGNLRRALRPAGRIAFITWADVTTNEWFMITGLAVLSVTRRPVRGVPGVRRAPFSLADPVLIDDLLRRAGFRDVRVTPHTAESVLSEADLEQRLRQSLTVTGLRESLQDLPDDLRRRAVEAVRRSLWARLTDGRIRLRVGVNIVEARR